MQILDNFLILAIHVLCFIAGIKLANYYNRQAKLDIKDALERQFVRLRTRSDADDPCKPYVHHGFVQTVPVTPVYPSGDYDGDGPISPEFMEQLRQNGSAKTSFRKSDLS